MCSDFAQFNTAKGESTHFAPTHVITNAPYGKRLSGGEDLKAVHRRLGDWLKHNTQKPAEAWILTGSGDLAKGNLEIFICFFSNLCCNK
jgi:23S rRNA G2445 N2-methylase RlmL